MKKQITLIKLIIMIAAIGATFFGCDKKSAMNKPPKLAILIGIDEFRADRLLKYKDHFKGGFKRILDKGAWFQNSRLAHAPALSFPGHATLGTGSDPRVHGITSNSWIDLPSLPPNIDTVLLTRAHQDFDKQTIGDSLFTALSPKKLKVPTISDWFEKHHPDAKTVAISTGSAAIFYGSTNFSKKKDKHVYWLSTNGRFVTSTYYRESYPNWLNQFNENMWENYAKYSIWDLTVTNEQKMLVRNDTVPYEFDGVHTFFPHKAEEMMPKYDHESHLRWFRSFSPHQNLALFDLAKRSIDSLHLGKDEVVDLLSISLDLPDTVVHRFGPHSLETLDVIMRLDMVLEDFFRFLDQKLGKDNYVLAVSADHGSPGITEFELSQGRASIRVTSDDFKKALNATDSIVKQHFSKDDLPKVIAERLEKFSFIAKAMTHKELIDEMDSKDSILEPYKLSYIPSQPTTYPLWTEDNRYGNEVSKSHPALHGVFIEIPYKANFWPARSTHGGSYSYDRDVPILFYGSGVPRLKSQNEAFTRDLAPTLAFLSGVAMPAQINGKVLSFD